MHLRVGGIKLQRMTALTMLRKADRPMICTRGIGVMAVRTLQFRPICFAHSPGEVQLMIEAKGVGILSTRSEKIEFWMIDAELIYITGEQRAGECGLGAFAARQACMLQQIFAVAMATGAFRGGTSVQSAITFVFGVTT